MKRRPVCLVFLFLMLCLYVTDLVGISMINGNPLPVSVQKYISEHPKLTVSGEVQNCQAAEYSLSVYLKQVYLTDQSENSLIPAISQRYGQLVFCCFLQFCIDINIFNIFCNIKCKVLFFIVIIAVIRSQNFFSDFFSV